MRVRLALNHTFLEGIATLPLEQARDRINAWNRLRAKAKPETFDTQWPYLHKEFGSAHADPHSQPPLTLKSWLRQILDTVPAHNDAVRIQLREAAIFLGHLTRGPFWIDELHVAPTAQCLIEPSLADADSHARELAQHILRNQALPGAEPVCIASPADHRNLTEPEYRLLEDGPAPVSSVRNLREPADLLRLDILSTYQPLIFHSAQEVLTHVKTQWGSELVILSDAEQSAAAFNWPPGYDFNELARCLIGLVHYKRARDEGADEKQAYEHYYCVTRMRVSGEMPGTMRRAQCVAERTFALPSGDRFCFEPHAKPGAARVHFLWRKLPDGASFVYVGHCGKHLSV